jgi:threonine dehydrogenase-like Zn-dependent dehydrogenase
MGSRNAFPEDFRQVIQMLKQRLFPVEEAVSAIVRIEEAPALLRAWTENPSRFSKIMVSMK